MFRGTLKQNQCAQNHKNNSSYLRTFQNPFEDRSTPDRIAPEFCDEQSCTGCHEKDSRQVSVLPSMGQPKHNRNCDRKKTECGISLHWVNSDAKWRIAPPLGQGIGIDHGPWHSRTCAVSRTSHQRADLFEPQPERGGCG